MSNQATAPKNVTKMIELLSENMAQVNNGDININAANAISKLAGKITSAAKLQLEYDKLRTSTPDIAFLEK